MSRDSTIPHQTNKWHETVAEIAEVVPLATVDADVQVVTVDSMVERSKAIIVIMLTVRSLQLGWDRNLFGLLTVSGDSMILSWPSGRSGSSGSCRLAKMTSRPEPASVLGRPPTRAW